MMSRGASHEIPFNSLSFFFFHFYLVKDIEMCELRTYLYSWHKRLGLAVTYVAFHQRTSLQKRRNSQLTHLACRSGADGKVSCAIVAWVATMVSRT